VPQPCRAACRSNAAVRMGLSLPIPELPSYSIDAGSSRQSATGAAGSGRLDSTIVSSASTSISRPLGTPRPAYT